MRPLEKVPTRALYALHKSIEKLPGLISITWADSCGGKCALGSLGVNFETYATDLVRVCLEVGLECTLPQPGFPSLGPEAGSISVLNSKCKGTDKERREFMLRHIVNELRQREKSLPVKKAEYQEVK